MPDVRVRVASPCPADWNQMVGDDRVRHCGQCDLNVYNISAMTAVEAQELVRKHEGRMCLRFYHRRDGSILTQNCPVGLKVVMRRLSRVAGIALAAGINAVSLHGQAAHIAPAQVAQADTGLELHVMDAHGKACPKAQIALFTLSGEPVATAVADEHGISRLTHLSPGTRILKVDAAGFLPFEQHIFIREHVTFVLETSPEAPLIETSQGPIAVTGGATLTLQEAPEPNPPKQDVPKENPPLIDNRAAAVPSTFGNTVLTTGGAIIIENKPVQEAKPHSESNSAETRKLGFWRRTLGKVFHHRH
ncbi:MAG TPA: carboxypeptidase-like regulatory domain-containing protein [Candidatus Angelobacter sp.]